MIELERMVGDDANTTQTSEKTKDNNGSSLITEMLVATIYILGSFFPVILVMLNHPTPSSGHSGILFAAKKPMHPMPPSQKIVFLIALLSPLVIFLGNIFYDGISRLFSSYLRNYFDVNQCRRTKKRAHDIRHKENLGIELQTYTNISNYENPKTGLKN